METIMYANYNELESKTGVFAFLDMETCFACSEYLKELKGKNLEYWTIVVMQEDEAKHFNEMGFNLPLTRLYNNDKLEIEIAGVLFETQLLKLYNRISTLIGTNTNGLELSSLNDIKTGVATAKPMTVQYFKATEFINVELLGEEIIARKGQYVVMYKSTKIEVLDDEEFHRRFE